MKAAFLTLTLIISELLSQTDLTHLENLYFIAMDYNSPEVAEFARGFKSDTSTDIRTICNIYSYFRNNWKNSPAASDTVRVNKASLSLRTLSGTAADYSVLMASVLKSLGLESRVVVTENHSYPEIYICNRCDPEMYLETINEYYKDKFSGNNVIKYAKEIFYHETRNGDIWLNLDFNSLYPGGPFPPNNEIITVIYP